MEGEYPPMEYHARMRWEQEQAGEYIHTPFSPAPPSEYHARKALDAKYAAIKKERKRRGW